MGFYGLVTLLQRKDTEKIAEKVKTDDFFPYLFTPLLIRFSNQTV